MYSDFFSSFSTSSAPLAAASFSFLAISSFEVSFFLSSSLLLSDAAHGQAAAATRCSRRRDEAV